MPVKDKTTPWRGRVGDLAKFNRAIDQGAAAAVAMAKWRKEMREAGTPVEHSPGKVETDKESRIARKRRKAKRKAVIKDQKK